MRGRGPFGGARGCEGKGQELGPRGLLTGVLGAGVRSQDFTLGVVGSHGWFVSTEQSFVAERKTEWERRGRGPDGKSGGCCQGQGRHGDGGLRLEKIGLCGRKPFCRGVPAHEGPEKNRAGTGEGVNPLQLPCLLGIQYLLTHLEPLVHPKCTSAKNVTMETTVGSGSLPTSRPTGTVQLG